MSYYKTIVEKDSSIKNIHKIIPYRCRVSDYEDNIHDIVASWFETNEGKFIKENSNSIDIIKQINVNDFSIDVAVTIEIEESKLIEYKLKFN